MDTGKSRSKWIRTILKYAIPIVLIMSILISLFVRNYIREMEYQKTVWPGQAMENINYAPYLTYEPFSGKLFKIHPTHLYKIDWTSIKGEDGGKDDPFKQSIKWHDVTDRAKIEEWVELLNSFRYTSWRAENRRLARPEGNKISRMYINLCHPSDEEFAEAIPWHEIILCKSSLHVGDCWYYGDQEFFDQLRELAYGDVWG